MKKICFIVLLNFCLNLSLSGQRPLPIDMSKEGLLEEVTAWDQKDSLRRVEVLNELAFRFRYDANQRDVVWAWIQEAIQLSEALGYTKGKGDALMRRGLLEEKNGHLDGAVAAYREVLIIRRDSLQDYGPAANVCNNLANVFKQQKDSIPQAIAWYRKGILLAEKEADHISGDRCKARIMNNLGKLFTQTGELDSALFYLDKALVVRKQLGDTRGIANVLLNRGLLYKAILNLSQFKADIEEALVLFRQVEDDGGIGKCLLALGDYYALSHDFSTAISYYEQVLPYRNELELKHLGILFQNKGIAHLKTGQLKAAAETYENALVFFKAAGDDNGLALLYLNYGSFYYDQKNYPEAIKNYKASLARYGKMADKDSKSKIFNLLGHAYAELGMLDSALTFTMAHNKLQDTLNRAYQDAMNYKQNMVTAERKIESLEREKEKENQRKMITYTIASLVLMGLLLGLTIMGLFINRQRRRLAEQSQAISRQKVIDLMREKELEKNYAWMNGVESTRKRIGRELHDGLGSMLSMVKVYFASINDKIEAIQEENRQKYDKAYSLLDEACDKVRTLSHEMSSAILLKFGLPAQLETLATTLRESGHLEVELSVHGLKERLDSEMEFNIYRIIQELVNNVIKHAKASRLSIQVNRFDEMINIMVEDNGVGFNVEEMSKKGGMGMKNLAARLHELDGTYTIDSRPGNGTSIAIDIPMFQTEPIN